MWSISESGVGFVWVYFWNLADLFEFLKPGDMG